MSSSKEIVNWFRGGFMLGSLIALCIFVPAAPLLFNEELNFPYSTYIEDGVTLVEGEKAVERLPDKLQEAVARLRFGTNAYTLEEATVKNKLKGDGIQHDHTALWLERPSGALQRRRIFVGVSHDIVAKPERLLKIELSEDKLKELLDRFPAELREPALTTYQSGGYKAYGLGPVTYYRFSTVSDVCAIQLIKEKLLPVDIANQRQRFLVDEVDVFVEDTSVMSGSHPNAHF